MTKVEALKRLKDLLLAADPEAAHVEADEILLLMIDDPEISAAFEAIRKWYS